MRLKDLGLLVVSTMALAGTIPAGAIAAQEPGARRGEPALVSPDVTPDHRVTFRLKAPEAKAVTVSGDFGSDVEMRKGADGIWTATAGPLDPEMYVYFFVVDGVRLTDPSNPQVKIGYVTSTTTSLFTVPGDAPAFFGGMPVPSPLIAAPP
jgi:enterochelin esterase family protein